MSYTRLYHKNKINGYNETKIGSWFMNIDDFDDEVEEYERNKGE